MMHDNAYDHILLYIYTFVYLHILPLCLVGEYTVISYPDAHLKVAGLRRSFRVFQGKSHLSSVAGGRCAYLHEIRKLN